MRFSFLFWLPSGSLHLLLDNRNGEMFKAIWKLWGNGWCSLENDAFQV